MRLILATNHLGLGGSESYLLTVGEQLDRLGHEITIFALEVGPGAEVARSRGLRVVDEAELPAECDGALVQDAGVSLQLALRYPGASQVFVAHSETFDLQLPPQLAGIVGTVVALNDRVHERLRALAVDVEIVRLRQPIDTERFVSEGPLPALPRSALLLSNNPVADRLAMLEAACRDLGLNLSRLGGDAGQTGDPRSEIATSDIVIGYGRSILEAMACGRAAYVYDRHGGDGWVTADSYSQIEAGGFSGRSGLEIVDASRLRADLALYVPSMGPVNHDIVVSYHRANVHAQSLVGILEKGIKQAPAQHHPLEEMARLVRLEWRARVDAQALAAENGRLQGELDKLRREKEDERKEAEEEQVEAVVRTAKHFRESLSWRLTRPLRATGRLLRRLRLVG